MASSVSLSFSLLLFSPISTLLELQQKKSALFKLSRQTTSRKEINLVALCSKIDLFSSHLKKDLLSVNQTDLGYLADAVDNCCEHLHYCMNVSSCTRKLVVGYWMGPDIDDGWGFVEAVVDQLT